MDKYYIKYLKYKYKYHNLKKIDNQKGGDISKEIILFKANWCGHCQNFMPTWDKLSTNFKDKYNFTKYDGDINTNEVSEYKINGFPTIIVKKGNELYEYTGKNTYESVLNFIEKI